MQKELLRMENIVKTFPGVKALKDVYKRQAMTMIQDVLKATGITATAGIGTNMYRLFSFYFQALIGLYF